MRLQTLRIAPPRSGGGRTITFLALALLFGSSLSFFLVLIVESQPNHYHHTPFRLPPPPTLHSARKDAARSLSFPAEKPEPDPFPMREPDEIAHFKKPYSLGVKISDWDQQRMSWLSRNSQFSNYVNGKPRILLVTGSQPAPCENPLGDHYLLKLIKNKFDYCRLHDVEIFYNLAHMDTVMTGYWAKLPVIRELMLSHPEVEWIWWMDSDAMFTDMAFELPVDKYKDHNAVFHGWDELVYNKKTWFGLNTGIFLLRNCQWSLDLLDAWAPMGPKGKIREEAGKLLAASLKERPVFEADDQSALVYLLIKQREKWGSKVFLESDYCLHGYWVHLVEKYEEMMEKKDPDDRWPFVTHFVGCKPCGNGASYAVERCLQQMERAFNFADNQVLQMYGFHHEHLGTANLKRIGNETNTPLEIN